jgi:hypothetical protein
MFTDAPKDTVVTWCSYHRTSPEYLPDSKKDDLVLWLDGRVEKRPAADYNVQCVVK